MSGTGWVAAASTSARAGICRRTHALRDRRQRGGGNGGGPRPARPGRRGPHQPRLRRARPLLLAPRAHVRVRGPDAPPGHRALRPAALRADALRAGLEAGEGGGSGGEGARLRGRLPPRVRRPPPRRGLARPPGALAGLGGPRDARLRHAAGPGGPRPGGGEGRPGDRHRGRPGRGRGRRGAARPRPPRDLRRPGVLVLPPGPRSERGRDRGRAPALPRPRRAPRRERGRDRAGRGRCRAGRAPLPRPGKRGGRSRGGGGRPRGRRDRRGAQHRLPRRERDHALPRRGRSRPTTPCGRRWPASGPRATART